MSSPDVDRWIVASSGGFVGTAVNIINVTVLNIVFVNIVIARASVTVSFIAFFTYGIAVTRTSIYANRFPGITTTISISITATTTISLG